MVAAVEGGQQLRGMIRIADGLVEIDYAVELAGSTDPGVDLLADLLLLGTVETVIERVAEEGMPERGNRRADGADSFFVRAGDELTIATDQILGGHGFGLRYERAREKHVINAESEDDVFHTSLSEHVTVETHEARLTQGRP